MYSRKQYDEELKEKVKNKEPTFRIGAQAHNV